jgi:hypothetical protein
MEGTPPFHERRFASSTRFSWMHRLPLLALATIIAGNAHADNSGHANHEARFTGALVSPAPPLPKGLFNVEPYLIQTHVVGQYGADGHRRDSDDVADDWRLTVPMTYGVTDRLTLGATVNAVFAPDDDAQRHVTAGDTTLTAYWLVAMGKGEHTPSLTLAAFHNLTTGQHDRLEQRRLANATGSGAESTTLALIAQSYFLPGRNLRGRAGLSWRLPGAQAGIHGQSDYGTTAGFQGHAELGSAAQANIGLEYSINRTWVLASDIVYEQESSTHLRGQQQTAKGAIAVTRDSPSSWRMSLAPAVEYHWTDNTGMILGAFVSVDGRNSAAVVSPQVAVNVAF